MVVDSRSLPAEARLDTDLCIVGGGTAGITLARALIGSPFRVCLLESGGLEPDPETQSLARGENTGFPYFPLDTARSRSVGGSGTRWDIPIGGDRVGPRIRPLDAIDFETRDWVPHSGWPFGKRELDPYYASAEAVCGTEPATYDVDAWREPGRREPLPLDSGDVRTIIYKFCWRERLARQHSQEVMRADDVTVYLHATVLEIEDNQAGSEVTRMRVGTLQGNQFSVYAKVFVLAAGGIETPRLMLLSNTRRPDGLGNQHDLVGRFFMEHLHFWSGMLVVDGPHAFERTGLYNEIHNVNGVPVVGKLALDDQVLRRERLLNQNVQLFPRLRPDPFKYRKVSREPLSALGAVLRGKDRSRTVQHLRTALTGWNDVAVAAFRKMRRAGSGLPTTPVFIFANMSEQVPNAESRVMLGSELDALGQRRVQLHWKVTPQDIRSIARTQQIIGGALEHAGLGRFYQQLVDDVPPTTTHGGYHHMGTTRMHVDPKRGVVDPSCRVHGIHNLYVAGPSVFPTGGYANPVLTIIALTLRLAEHLKRVVA